MSKDILDEVEKYSGPRVCPECGYQFPLGEFVRRYIMSFGLSKWSCRGCGELIKCDFIKIQMLWTLGIVITGVSIGLLASYFDFLLLNIIFLILFFIYALLTFHYVKFEKHK